MWLYYNLWILSQTINIINRLKLQKFDSLSLNSIMVLLFRSFSYFVSHFYRSSHTPPSYFFFYLPSPTLTSFFIAVHSSYSTIRHSDIKNDLGTSDVSLIGLPPISLRYLHLIVLVIRDIMFLLTMWVSLQECRLLRSVLRPILFLLFIKPPCCQYFIQLPQYGGIRTQSLLS